MTAAEKVQAQNVGPVLEPVKVTRQEELQFGMAMAPVVRRLANAARELEQARMQVNVLGEECHYADQAAMGKVNPPADFDEHGRSPMTRWLEALYDRVRAQSDDAHRLLIAVGIEAMDHEQRHALPPPAHHPV